MNHKKEGVMKRVLEEFSNVLYAFVIALGLHILCIDLPIYFAIFRR